jgi:hypothetical protein
VKWSPIIPVTQFAPSADPTTEGILTDVENVIPVERGWRSAYSLGETGMASLTATCVGAAMCQLMDGSLVIVAGTASDLWLRSSNTWSEISENGVTYHATSDLRWRFAMMGNNILAATCSDTIAVSASGATFGAIASAPKATLIESVYGFIMAANTNEATNGDQSDRWWCSGLFDHTDWTPNATTQCTTGRLVDTPGPILGLRRLGANVIAYKQSSMYLGQYVQPPTVWDWSLISSNIGCGSHEAIVNIGKAHLFPGIDNFYLFDGASVTAIGEPIREWFFDATLQPGSSELIQAAHDPAKKLVYWFFPAAGLAGSINRCVVFNYQLSRWGYATYDIEATLDYTAAGVTYDGLGTFYTTFDAGINRTYDSPAWTNEKVAPAVIDNTHVLKTIDGPGLNSTFTTWHIGDDQAFTLIRRARIRWLDDPTTAALCYYATNEHGSAFSMCAGAVSQTQNKFDVLNSARWHRLKFSTTGTHEFSGIAVDLEPQGTW